MVSYSSVPVGCSAFIHYTEISPELYSYVIGIIHCKEMIDGFSVI